MRKEKEIAILMQDKCTMEEAKRHLERGTIIYELNDFLENKDEYLHALDTEEKERFIHLVESGTAPEDYGIVSYGGERYLIQYSL